MGIWKAADFNACAYKSQTTRQLQELSEGSIDENNNVEVVSSLQNLTSEPEILSTTDIILSTDILEKVVITNANYNETGSIVVQVVDNLMRSDKSFLAKSQLRTNSSTRIVESLETILDNIPLTNSSFRFVASKIAVEVITTSPVNYSGVTYGVLSNETSPSVFSIQYLVNDVTVSLSLPSSLLTITNSSSARLVFSLYSSDALFQHSKQGLKATAKYHSRMVNSDVISAHVKDMTFANLSEPIKLRFTPQRKGEIGTLSCVYWKFDALGGIGDWSIDGCTLVEYSHGLSLCECNHLTNFAILMDVDIDNRVTSSHALALSIISYIGCGLSLIGLALVLLTFIIFRDLATTKPNKFLINLSASLFALIVVFISGVERTRPVWGCKITAILLHYLSLVVFSWMSIEALNMFLMFVVVMPKHISRFFLKSMFFAWGLPALIVGVTAVISHDNYKGDNFCRVHGLPFYISLLSPVLLLLSLNFIAYVFIMHSLLTSESRVTSDQKTPRKTQLRRAVAISVLLGLTWLFGALAISEAKLVFQYLFCIFNSFQGFFIFLFYCFLQETIRRRWIYLIRHKKIKGSYSTTYNTEQGQAMISAKKLQTT